MWRAILSAQQYGVIYLVSRSEARQYFQPLIEEHPAEGDIIDSFRRQDAVAIRVINYGVHRYVTEGGLQINHPARLVPPSAISSIGKRHIAVRIKDFKRPAEEILAETGPFSICTTSPTSPRPHYHRSCLATNTLTISLSCQQALRLSSVRLA